MSNYTSVNSADSELQFSIVPYQSEDSNTVKQLCKESIEVLCTRDYNYQQTQALASCYSSEYDSGIIRTIDNIVYDLIGNIATFVDTIAAQNCDRPSAVVARVGDNLIGYASIISYSLASEDSLLAALFVHPEYVRRGVGTKLLQTLEDRARENKDKVIRIYATPTGEPFYQANGYQSIERYSSFIQGVRIPFVYMEKWLVTPSEIEKFFWDTSQQGIINFGRLITETEALFRSAFDEE